MKHLPTYSVIVLLAAPGQAQIVVDHQPIQSGGPAADTEFLDMIGQPNSQRLADNFMIPAPGPNPPPIPITEIAWWGFYDQDNPPLTETMRVRFYGVRPSDGLPDEQNILYEQSFLNPSRVATGKVVFVGELPLEYFYHVNPTVPPQLTAETPYWLEVVQLGDIETAFRWETSAADMDGHAFINPLVVDWQYTMPATLGDLAFQISTIPEPCTLGLIMIGLIGLARKRRRR